jgi:hypothetical protein
MLPFSDGKHNVYGPDTLEVMCFATWIGESLKETSLI